jgi:hypothetical protein
LNSAVRAPPICKNPVGDGAKRTMTVILEGWGSRDPISTMRRGVWARQTAYCPGVWGLLATHSCLREGAAIFGITRGIWYYAVGRETMVARGSVPSSCYTITIDDRNSLS